MGMFKKGYICLPIETMSKFYLRFINNIFLIWTGTTDQLMKFKQQINVHASVKFDFNFSNKEINFLDTVANQVNWKPSSTGKNRIDRLIYIVNQNSLSL